MKIRIYSMLGTLHSWSFTIQSIARAINRIGGHELFLKSTNNLEYFPEDLKPNLLPGYHGYLIQGDTNFIDGQGNEIVVTKTAPTPEIADENRPYDLELAYTIFYQNIRRYYNETKCRATIWNYESSILPKGWSIYARCVDYILPSSQFSYDIFANNNIPKDKMLVVPHGVDTNIFNPNIPPYKFKTDKKVKILHNAIPHGRKLHDRVIKGYLDTFTGNDDVCLILKTKFLEESVEKPFEINVKKILEENLKGRKNPPEIEVVTSFIPDIGSLYTGSDIIISMSSTEGFSLTLLEGLACEKLIIAPRHGGQLDFLNDSNSLLVNTKEMLAPKNQQYWGYMEGATVGDPSLNHFKELLYHAYKNLDSEKERIKEGSKKTVEHFTWERAAQMILDLPAKTTLSISSKREANKKRRVLYIVPYSMVGGGEVWVREAIKQLDRSLYEPYVALVSGTNEHFKRSLIDLGAVVEELFGLGREYALKCLIESEKYDIVHFYNSFSIYMVIQECFKQGYRGRVIETVHSELNWDDSMTKVSVRNDFVTAITTVSNMMGRKLLKMGNKNVIVLQQQIDWGKFNVPRSKQVLEELGIYNDFVVGFVGRLSPEKNIPLIIQCAKNIPTIDFVIVGDGPQEGPLKQMGSSLSNIHFVGKRNDVEKFYSAFDILILPSLMEGMPLVILEAMSAGTPVIASDVGAILEVVYDGVNGSLIWNPQSSDLFSREILKFKNNKALWDRCSINSLAISKSCREKSMNLNINYIYNLLFKG